MIRPTPLLLLAFAYVLGFVCCFGPIMVEVDREAEAVARSCQARYETDEQRWYCSLGAPGGGTALIRAVGWPLWVSYWTARR